MRKITAGIATGFGKVRGLIGRDARPLVIKTRFGIHTFGLKYPIDVVVLDNKNRIVKIKQNLNPNKVFFWNPKHNKVLEMPVGYIKKHGLSEGLMIHIWYNT